MKKYKSKNTRRKFLKQAGLAAFGYTTALSSVAKLQALNAAAINNSFVLGDGEYKALVCLFQSGGHDSFNMLVPRGNAEYAEYATTRSNLALAQDSLLAINPLTSDGKQYGLHPAMSGVQNLFESGKLAFVNNIGTMIEPTTKAQFQNESVPLPLGLFSHADQIQQWQTASPHYRTPVGWGGKLADMMQEMNTNENISMNISMSGTNVFQYGQDSIEFSADPYNGSDGLYGYGTTWGQYPARNAAIDQMFNHNYEDIYKNTYANVFKQGLAGSLEFREAVDSVPAFTTQFTDNRISQSFHMVAKAIAAREQLGFKRQIFFINYGGWDHHDELLENQNNMLGTVNNAMSEFATVLEEMGMFDNVTTFTISEFGRTLTSNGNGTDHAWGGNVMAMGGAVNGQNMFGAYPSLELGSEHELGNGVMLPTLSSDMYFAELALWFGVPPSDLPLLFPNVSNFYDVNGGLPIGFLNV